MELYITHYLTYFDFCLFKWKMLHKNMEGGAISIVLTLELSELFDIAFLIVMFSKFPHVLATPKWICYLTLFLLIVNNWWAASFSNKIITLRYNVVLVGRHMCRKPFFSPVDFILKNPLWETETMDNAKATYYTLIFTIYTYPW